MSIDNIPDGVADNAGYTSEFFEIIAMAQGFISPLEAQDTKSAEAYLESSEVRGVLSALPEILARMQCDGRNAEHAPLGERPQSIREGAEFSPVHSNAANEVRHRHPAGLPATSVAREPAVQSAEIGLIIALLVLALLILAVAWASQD